jgi:hypothetical protein
MIAENPLPQSEDSYYRINFRALGDGTEAEGTVGWREGQENRVAFQIWDGPSFAAEGHDLHDAFCKARAGIEARGFLPLIAGARAEVPADPHDLFEPARSAEIVPLDDVGESAAGATAPRYEPLLWALAALILLALLLPGLAHAEIPVPGKVVRFPNAPYAWRYEGPDLDPRIVILDNKTGEPTARYDIGGGSFCDDDADNCELDGLFPLVLANAAKEPVLAVVAHVGAHGQRLSVFRPLRDKAKPVFEATAEFALLFKVLPGGLLVEMEQADKDGHVTRDMKMWLTGDDRPCPAAPDVRLAAPPPPSPPAAKFTLKLQRITRERDLAAFMKLLGDDVLVSFGGNGGKQEFTEHWKLGTTAGEATFWRVMDRLLAQPGWNTDDTPQTLTFPWYFAAWPDGDEPYDVYLSEPGTALRAGPDAKAPLFATLGFEVLRFRPPEHGEDEIDWHATGWLPVASTDHCLAYVRAEDTVPLLGTRLVARETNDGWEIEAMVVGD